MKGLGIWLYNRVIGNKVTSIVAVAFTLISESLNYFGALPLPNWAHVIIGGFSTLLLLSKDSLLGMAAKLPPTLMWLALLSASGCALFQKTVAVGTLEVQACGAQAVELYQDVTTALNSTEWESKLTQLATCIPDGIALVKCALTAYLKATEAQPAPLAASTGYERVESAQRVRAKAWIVAH